jgi:ADP-ribosyl-[dinitrogen reductase] hydrolase
MGDASRPRHAATIRGCLLGGALGDALGAPVEFASLGAIRARHGPDGIREPPPQAPFTDDTQMTLFTAEAMVLAADRGTPVRDELWAAYRRWLLTQRGLGADEDPEPGGLLADRRLHVQAAPGTTCLQALAAGEPGGLDATRTPPGEPPLPGRSPVNDSKGCGGVMRVAPIGLAGWGADRSFQVAAEAAALTHGHASGYLSAGVLAAVLSALDDGAALPEALDEALAVLTRWPGAEEVLDRVDAARAAARSAPRSAETVETLGAGWVGEEALAIAVYCALTAEDFASCVRLAVNHSGDSDSTGAITGNLLGAMLGEDALPEPWLDRLADRDIVEATANQLVAVRARGGAAEPDPRQD